MNCRSVRIITKVHDDRDEYGVETMVGLYDLPVRPRYQLQKDSQEDQAKFKVVL